jgi:hypothetical protein
MEPGGLFVLSTSKFCTGFGSVMHLKFRSGSGSVKG